ncbi:16S rRNA (guanine(966)-N(2))-methyltransferase RsmD [Pacificimonas sp. WHA3]|uniref:16S rRNA (Guanine(966)-N(2))-methyltransferase RsmD n=1 Tax=Pacificimonas pallii TaxID=2827236 RepID=A0ABS6SDJ7_9SPHN|nr:16S rRNA (guanine(966)-N(2))-methyltransferase RsmD [Pacificimonas pallii]MBV7256492.1 16S rRNA (guanine(966)-N(2))-methyltransferase RsmD [Pacificimonas pallii]
MRIIAGTWRGRTLFAPEGTGTRPTSARAREALFSMLASRLADAHGRGFDGLRVADLFAGTGALGLEALSRGGAHCTFIERDAAALHLLKRNIDALGANADVMPRDAARPGTARAPCHLVFVDPPYDQGLTAPTLRALTDGHWFAPGALIAVETSRAESVEVEGLETLTTRIYGKARIALLRAAQG